MIFYCYKVYDQGTCHGMCMVGFINWTCPMRKDRYVAFTDYNLENNLIANTTISDDGVIGVDKKIAPVQNGVLNAKNLKEGVYKL